MLPTSYRDNEEHGMKKRFTRMLLNVRMRFSRDRRLLVLLVVVAGLLGFVAFRGVSGGESAVAAPVPQPAQAPKTEDDAEREQPKQEHPKEQQPKEQHPEVKQDPPKKDEGVASSSKPAETKPVVHGAGGTLGSGLPRGEPQLERQAAVKKAMKHAWDGYVKYAWGRDELKPVSKTHQNWLDIGLTIIDSLDTLWIMDMKEEFQKAREWVANELSFDKNREVSTFETSIRVFGGLLSAYDLSRDRVFLEKAKDIGDRLLKAFDGSKLGIPLSQVHLTNGHASLPSWTGGKAILSEVGTLQMEYVYLAKHLNNTMYAERVLDVFERLHEHNQKQGLHGLYPVYVDVNSGHQSGHVTLGALGDSFYEYLLKMWYLTDKKVPRFREMYDESASAIAEKMVKQTSPHKLWYFAELTSPTGSAVAEKMDELACFAAGGMFGYGAHGATFDRDRVIASEVASFCHEMWHRTASGIAPEWVSCANKEHDLEPGSGGNHYLLRPETIETYFYMWRLTKDPKYRDWAWEAFEAIEKACRVESGGYSGIRDVTAKNGGVKDDLQQSFFLAETLKYFYLVFSDDDTVNLDNVVLGTEAHPLSIFKEPVSEWAHLVRKFDPRIK